MTNIKKAIRQMAGNAPMQTYLCKVVSVDKHVCDCEPVSGGANFLDVRLRSILDNGTGGIILKPKVDSLVIIGLLENNEATAFVIAYSDIDELYFKSDGGMTFEVKKDVIKINGDTHGSVVKVKELTEKLNNLEDALNGLIAKFNTHTHPYVNVATPAVTSVTTQIDTDVITPTQKSEISNDKVKHG